MSHRSRIRWFMIVLALTGTLWGFFRMLRTGDTEDQPLPSSPSVDTLIVPKRIDTTVPRDSIPQGAIDTLVAVAIPSAVDTIPGPLPSPAATGNGWLRGTRLLIPVAGIRPDQLIDTYNDARTEGRVHNAIDIIAPLNTPVLAAADGPVVRLFKSERGGTTIYQMNPDSTAVYYYAHLDHYADNLVAGHFAHRGEVIGYVGDTGNAGPGNYHLHFAIWLITDPKHYWDGEDINPYPLLHGTP